MSIVQKKIDISLKIKSAFVNQINEAKSVSVIWRRGQRELDSKPGQIDPATHNAKIDDIFKMKTSLDFDIDEYKFESKMSILELVFSETKQAIGHAEFDLGSYTNKIRDTTVKTILDLKSEKFPGAQIYIYVNIQLLDPLPEKSSGTKGGAPSDNRVTTVNGPKTEKGEVINIKEQQAKIKEMEGKRNVEQLMEKKIRLEQENDRLKFQLEQAKIEQYVDVLQLIKEKMEVKKGIQSKIEKYSKQEQIILKVLNIINNSTHEDYELFKAEDAQIDAKFAEITKEFELKKKKKLMFERIKKNTSDFEYFSACAPEY